MNRLLGIAAALSLAAVLTASAQPSTLFGTVRDGETNRPLIGANVVLSLADWSAGAATDTAGRFEIAVPAPGRYTVTVSFVGFTTVRDSVGVSGASVYDVDLVPLDLYVSPITVTASRRPEKALDAPSAVTVLDARTLDARTVLSPADQLHDAPAVDVVHTGINSSRVVVRGFNDNLASSLLTLMDYRIAQAPSVRLTAMQLLPASTMDIERIEVVSGPAAALYGPNAANGVVHVFSRSPFDDPGTSTSFAGGEQAIRLGSIRHATRLSPRLAFKVTGQWYEGTDFEYFSPFEQDARSEALAAGAHADTLRIGRRDFDVRNVNVGGRLDYRLGGDRTVILSGGVTRGSNIEITPTGAAQVEGARLGFLQVRYAAPKVFAQAYGNLLNSGDSYFLRTGAPFLDRSRLFATQVQRRSTAGSALDLTYGFDIFHTRPVGEGTANGRFETDDQSTESGAYAQADLRLFEPVTLVLAARVDHHDRLRDTFFSPRAAVVVKPAPMHSLRLTFNRAFATPKTNHLFTDVLGRQDIFGLSGLTDAFGYGPSADLRVQGMIGGYTFDRDATGRARFRSDFSTNESAYIDFGDPAFTQTMWDVARFATIAGLAENLAATGLIDAGSVEAVSAALDRVLPDDVVGVGQVMKQLDLERQEFAVVDGVADVPRLDITRTDAIEIGYKGLPARNVALEVSAYWSRIRDFIGPFFVGTPNVFLDAASLNAALAPAVRDLLASDQAAADVLQQLDRAAIFGNGDGDPSGEIAAIVSTGVANAIPFGTVSPVEAFDPTAILLMRRNFGDISLYGAEASAVVFLSRSLRAVVNYGWTSDDYFENVDGIDDIALNAPRHKMGGSVEYDGSRIGARLRWYAVDGYPVRSDIYVGSVERYALVDASVSYRVRSDSRIVLSAQNLLDNRHRQFVDVPELGRLAILRLDVSF